MELAQIIGLVSGKVKTSLGAYWSGEYVWMPFGIRVLSLEVVAIQLSGLEL